MSLMNIVPLSPEPVGTSIPEWVGSRWTPGHVVRIDTERGTYECLNSPHSTQAEALVQRALLASRKASLIQRFRLWLKG